MTLRIFTLALCSFLMLQDADSFGQNSSQTEIHGKVITSKSNMIIPFAKVYNKSIGQGTLTDLEGKFSIPINSFSDTLMISFIGFETLQLTNLKDVNESIKLKESVQIISEVIASAKANEYLYDLIIASGKKIPKKNSQSKGYFELKTTIENQQVELLEAYYNIEANNYNIHNLDLKAGRFALTDYYNTKFVSLASSRSIVLLKLFSENLHYPFSPTEFNKRGLQKAFKVSLNSKFVNEEKKTVFVIDYFPKDSSSNYFNGTIWIDSNQQRVLKITQNTENALRHPFISIVPGIDSISNVNLLINRTFRHTQKEVLVDHIDFNYSMHYYSRPTKNTSFRVGGVDMDYTISTQAVLMSYAQNEQFQLPYFNFPVDYIDDYKKISTVPYNSFFWEKNTENKVQIKSTENDEFFKNSSKTRSDNFKLQSGQEQKIVDGFEKPYRTWSENRIIFKEDRAKILEMEENRFDNSSRYSLKVQLFCDINTYGDSTHILTKTIIDPYESYYYLPINDLTHCFINIYFDLMEIERRKLDLAFQEAQSKKQDLKEVYTLFNLNLELYSRTVLKDLDRGNNFSQLEKYNNTVHQELGINNMELFKIVEE